MNIEWLKKLIRLVEESDIDSLEVERLSTRVRISKSPPVGGGAVAHVPAAQSAAPAPPAPEPGPPAADASAVTTSAPPDGLVEVLSPMVGTFYRAPSPDSPPFVSVGDKVESGQTLCILEAMKLMNELQAEVGGTIREISVENADPVEFGQVLFRIDPA